MDSGSGSFWAIEASSQPSAAHILETPEFTLEDVLLTNGVINDAQFDVSSVITYLCRHENLERIIDYITIHCKRQEYSVSEDSSNTVKTDASDTSDADTKPYTPSSPTGFTLESVSHADKDKLPHMASEVIFYSAAISQAISDSTVLLDRLFAFLDCPYPVDPSCTGYFRKVMLVMLQRATPTLTEYLRRPCSVARFGAAIHMHCAMELLIVIGWDSGTGQIHDPSWLHETGLIPQLLAALHPSSDSFPDAGAHAARTLVDLIVKCPDSRVVSALHERGVIVQLFALALSVPAGGSADPAAPAAATRALTVLVVLAQRDICLRAYAHAQTQRRSGQEPPPLPIESPLAELVAAHAGRILDIAAGPTPQVPAGEPWVWPEPPSSAPTPAVPVAGDLPGDARLKALELLGVALRAATPAFCEAFSREHGFRRVLCAALLRPWHSLLHALVETCVCAALRSRAVSLARALIVDGDAVGWVVHAAAWATRCAATGRHGRPGVMAYVKRLSGIIARVVGSGSEAAYAEVRERVSAEQWAALAQLSQDDARSPPLQLYRALRITLSARPEAGGARSDDLGLDLDDDADDVYALATQLSRQQGAAPTSPTAPAAAESVDEDEDEDERGEDEGGAYARRMLTRVTHDGGPQEDISFEQSAEQRETELNRNRAALHAMLARVRGGDDEDEDGDESADKSEDDSHEDSFVEAGDGVGEGDDDGWPFGGDSAGESREEDLGFNTFDFSSFTSSK